MGAEFLGKNLQIIRELRPSTRRLAVLANVANPITRVFVAQLKPAAQTAHVEIHPIMVLPAEKLETAFDEMHRERADAVVVKGTLVQQEAVDLEFEISSLLILAKSCLEG